MVVSLLMSAGTSGLTQQMTLFPEVTLTLGNFFLPILYISIYLFLLIISLILTMSQWCNTVSSHMTHWKSINHYRGHYFWCLKKRKNAECQESFTLSSGPFFFKVSGHLIPFFMFVARINDNKVWNKEIKKCLMLKDETKVRNDKSR